MPNFDIIKEIIPEESFRVKSIKDQFDLNIQSVIEKFSGNIDIENKPWSIGLIVGSSGSGKSTILNQIFPFHENFIYNSKSVLDNMPSGKTTEEITKTFNSVGFATVWSWLKPYSVLSNGEKMRVDLARAILNDYPVISFDEFTSVVDRTIAKTASFAIQKAIRKLKKQFIAASCHRDIIDWLEPDWIYDTDKKKFFFAPASLKDLPSKLKLENVNPKNGIFLKNIII